MTERQAWENGLIFTGIYWGKFDKEREAKYKAEIDRIKSQYKVRVVKVRESSGFSYYGDDNFSLVYHNDLEKLQHYLDSIPDRIEAAKKEYEKRLAEIEEFKQDTLNTMAKVEALRK